MPDGTAAARVVIRGAVQGTGFRPFVYRLARGLGLTGSIRNTPFGVLIHVEGGVAALDDFRRRLPAEAPPAAMLRCVVVETAELAGAADFTIGDSDTAGELSVAVLPDLATCPECVRELFDPTDRRHRYPFLNCTACGPRLSIIEGLPYDRPRTAMKGFALCADCGREYDDPADRRFHAQPVACPSCGPRLAYVEAGTHGGAGDALETAVAAIRAGRIVGLKGLGGYQLLVDARNGPAVARLRARKGREEKPFAVMFPDLGALRSAARVSDAEAGWLTSAAAPILLLELVARGVVADQVAPGLRTVGAMLPYSPLHHLLMARLGFPIVCTSGNFSEEPMAIAAVEAEERLGAIADAFLHHDRPVVRAVDDSVARRVDGHLLVMRRARGFAPLPVPIGASLPTVRALGGHLKNTVAWASGRQLVVSQHIGDLDHPLSLEAQARTIADFERLFEFRPVAVACDLHRDYASTRVAEASGLPVVRVQHHHAHAASLLGEHDLNGEILAVTWDGTGFGPDGTVWGGEFLRATRTGYRRVARLLPFALPGGEAAARQPWRSALGALYAVKGLDLWELPLPPVHRAAQWKDVLNGLLRAPATVKTSSAGRLIDAVSAILGLRQESTYEAHAAMLLEQTVAPSGDAYPFSLLEREGDGADAPGLEIDWRPAIAAVVDDVERGTSAALVAGRFHRTLARMTASVAEWAGIPRVGLTGGCFQNAVLTQFAVEELRRRRFDVLTHSQIPPNDGGLSAGQALVAASRLLEERT
ncbi:MAG: carbamoyltransferase HypF [Gemmatimonadota bacterium]